MSESAATTIWSDVVGQPLAIEQLRKSASHGRTHAYLFVGPAGSTKLEAARAFSARIISGGEDPDDRNARLILAGTHPDVREVRRAGAAISAEQAREIVRVSALAPIESDQKVLILDEFHFLRPEGAALMLKTIEEPPSSTTFIVLCDFVPDDLITISSRCLRIEFRAISDGDVAARLVAEGTERGPAEAAAAAALGDLDRARLLANDTDLAARSDAFANTPHRLNGTGSIAVGCAKELLELIDAAAGPVIERHDAEISALDEQIAQHGERGSARKQLEERHKRELRRHRNDELRAGLATMAATYRDSAAGGGHGVDIGECAAAVHRIHEALSSLERNPNERLLVESLLWSLPDARGIH